MGAEPSHTVGAATPALLEETIGQNLSRTVAAHGDREALVVRHQGIRWTYAEFAEQVDRVARGLLARGFKTGDRIGIWAPNVSEWILVQYATARLGIVQVSINPAYRTHEVAYVLNQSGCRGLVAATTFKTSNYVAMVEEVRPEVPALEQVIFIGTDDWTSLLGAGESVTSADVAAVEATLSPRDPINLQYTSGTTGFPKGATLSHRNVLNNGYFVAEACGYTPEDRVLIPVPLYHCFGQVMGNIGCTTHGATAIYPAAAFEPIATLEAIQDEKATSLYGVPTMFIAQLSEDTFADYDTSSLRTGIMAGSPCPIEVMRRTMDEMNMDQVTIAYGMTETSPVSTQTATDDPVEKRVATVGRVQPHLEIKVINPATGETVPRGETGEFCTKGYSVMLGYWEDPEKTAESIDVEGWMHSGDLAVMDDEGYVNIVGRIKDLVIRGGENVYPREIEEFLYSHPSIRDVQVIGVPDEKYGEEIMAWVQVNEGASVTAQDVRDFCKGRIAHYKIPRYVQVVDEFPMTVTGKIQKFKLRDKAIEDLGLEADAAIQTA